MDNKQIPTPNASTLFTYLVKNCPFTEYDHTGKTLLGNDIPMLHIGSGEKTILMIGSSHANDRISESILLQFALDFCYQVINQRTLYGLNCAVAAETRHILIIPCLNPDGKSLCIHGPDPSCPLYERQLRLNKMKSNFSSWQGNARGILPQWNYNDNFAQRRDPPFTGEFPESEPECAFAVHTVQTFHPVFLLECSLFDQNILYTNCPETVRSIACNTDCNIYEQYIPGAPSWFANTYNLPSLHIACRHSQGQENSIYRQFRELLFRSLYTLAV